VTDPALRLVEVSKRYSLQRGWHVTSLREAALRLSGRVFGRGAGDDNHFWALRNVTFEVERGEAIGLIGANGAGKSTTLKILSRITVPTRGTFSVFGTLGALIEIGAGFHPDLSGRENVYLNGAIMGMSRDEIDRKLSDILAFAEIDQFVDTPIKFYSSGMTVRLGFSVAAHINPSILLVDEVLAVGDAAFQAKCLNKLAELRERDTTVVLVSHNMANIVKYCDRVIWIDHGSVREQGDPDTVVEQYLNSVQVGGEESKPAVPAAEDALIRICGVTITNAQGVARGPLQFGSTASIDIEYEVLGPVPDPVIGITFETAVGHMLSGITTRLAGVKVDTSLPRGRVRLVLSPVIFTRGVYRVSTAIHDSRLQRYLDVRSGIDVFSVEGPSIASREVSGHVVYPHHWDVECRS
jgi:ABC-type polysaccharide/polyol phosphate transport system ATPase subunit